MADQIPADQDRSRAPQETTESKANASESRRKAEAKIDALNAEILADLRRVDAFADMPDTLINRQKVKTKIVEAFSACILYRKAPQVVSEENFKLKSYRDAHLSAAKRVKAVDPERARQLQEIARQLPPKKDPVVFPPAMQPLDRLMAHLVAILWGTTEASLVEIYKFLPSVLAVFAKKAPGLEGEKKLKNPKARFTTYVRKIKAIGGAAFGEEYSSRPIRSTADVLNFLASRLFKSEDRVDLAHRTSRPRGPRRPRKKAKHPSPRAGRRRAE